MTNREVVKQLSTRSSKLFQWQIRSDEVTGLPGPSTSSTFTAEIVQKEVTSTSKPRPSRNITTRVNPGTHRSPAKSVQSSGKGMKKHCNNEKKKAAYTARRGTKQDISPEKPRSATPPHVPQPAIPHASSHSDSYKPGSKLIKSQDGDCGVFSKVK